MAAATAAYVIGGALLANQAKTAHDARRAAVKESDKMAVAERSRMADLTEQKKKKEFSQKQSVLRSQQLAKSAANEGRASTILGGSASPVSMPQPGSAPGLKTVLGN